MTAKELEMLIQAALDSEAEQAARREYKIPVNQRAYLCSIDSCNRPAYAKRLCNAHYMRLQKGKDLSRPLRTRTIRQTCHECNNNKPVNKHGGWGLCKSHYRLRRRLAMKRAAIRALGGRCGRCQQVVAVAAFDFHHRGAKTDSPSWLLLTKSVRAIATELAKCDLLCANCHRIVHGGDAMP